MGFIRVMSEIAAAAIVMAIVRQLVSAARAITVPLAMTSPIITGVSPRRAILCQEASR